LGAGRGDAKTAFLKTVIDFGRRVANRREYNDRRDETVQETNSRCRKREPAIPSAKFGPLFGHNAALTERRLLIAKPDLE
jgi:hypothetical protein